MLRGIDFSLRRGEFAALMGPSGSGKSTLLHIMGLLDKPTGGRILLDGQDTGALDDDALTRYRGRTLGFVFQFHHLLPEFTALENVMIPMAAGRRGSSPRCGTGRGRCSSGWGSPPGRQPGHHALRRAGAAGGHRPILAMEPKIVLADEPTGNLDTQTADEVFSLLREVNRDQRVTFLVVTHDRRLAERTDRIVELVDGRIVSDRPNEAR